MRIYLFFLAVLIMIGGRSLGAETRGGELDPSTGLYRYEACRYVETDWNDGDSFRVGLPSGEEVTVRLYEVDCFETSVQDTTAARRLRAQRRYFGISDYGETPRDSIEKAIELGEKATDFTREALREPFTVWTAHADARGSGERIYAFIRTAGRDSLADLLVKAGLARAHGVSRQTPEGVSQAESIERMGDLELSAAVGRRGVWAYTDWDALPRERLQERTELEELRVAMQLGPKVSADDPVALNRANKARLQQLPGIGPTLAERIVRHREDRPFEEKADLREVPGIGPKTFAELEALVTVGDGP
jgi:endonuclease YncB( thermonuclease family)